MFILYISIWLSSWQAKFQEYYHFSIIISGKHHKYQVSCSWFCPLYCSSMTLHVSIVKSYRSCRKSLNKSKLYTIDTLWAYIFRETIFTLTYPTDIFDNILCQSERSRLYFKCWRKYPQETKKNLQTKV